jgi:hypothetical protein
VIAAAVEGLVDEAVVQRLVAYAGGTVGVVYGKKGKRHLRDNINAYNQAARFAPWIVLTDLDQEADCAPLLRTDWLTNQAPMMEFRIAVHEVEAWLLSDRERLAEFLSVSEIRIPLTPESEIDPKKLMVNIARRSRRREIREDLVPRTESGRSEGPGYTSRITQFVLDNERGWRPSVAAARSDSLRRCLSGLRTLIRRSRDSRLA